MIGPGQCRHHAHRDSCISRDDAAERPARRKRVHTDPCRDAGPATGTRRAIGRKVAAAKAPAQHLVVGQVRTRAGERRDDRALPASRKVRAAPERRHTQEAEPAAERSSGPRRGLSLKRTVLAGHPLDYRPVPQFAKQAVEFRPRASRYPGGKILPASRSARRRRRPGSGRRRRSCPAPSRRARARLRRRCRRRSAPSRHGTR